MLNLWSLLSAFAAFMVLVILAQFLARRLWFAANATPAARPDRRWNTITTDPPEDPAMNAGRPFHDDPNYHDSAIRSSRR